MPIELDLKAILSSYAQLTLFILMLSIGLSQGFVNIAYLWRRPGLLGRCLLASFVLVPLAAMLINWVVPMPFAVRVGLAVMAICPGAPMIYRKLLKGRALPTLAGSFQVTTALLAVVMVPIWASIFAQIYPNDMAVAPATVFRQVALAQLIPIAAGLAIREWFPELADDLDQPVFKLGSFLLIGVLLLILIVALPQVIRIGLLPVVGAVLFAAACLLIGHFLGGPDPASRLTIAVANGTRNAGLALALATANFPDRGILAAIATYALFSAVAGSIYSNLYQKKFPQEDPATVWSDRRN
ncbi:MAG TPA: bile acid:sodium symporter [Leptolyngbyaceae cyanobacterium M65_K2018_010]|nr:bile acid:sodium symporter [Leptolyngbyaceae cyanobacterium M65_K2018_010]